MKHAKFLMIFILICLTFFCFKPVLAIDIGVRVGDNGNILFDDPGGGQNLYYGIVDTGGQDGHLIKLQTFTSPSTWTDRFRVDKGGNVTASGFVDGSQLCIAGDCKSSWAGIGGSDGYIGTAGSHTAGGWLTFTMSQGIDWNPTGDNAQIYAHQIGGNSFDLRVLLADDQASDERFTIYTDYWDGSGSDRTTHYFAANGSAYHEGGLSVGSLSSSGNGYFGGNVGIGTASPIGRLHVDGQYAYFSGSVIDDSASGKNLLPNWQMESDTYWVDPLEQTSVADFNGVNHYAHDSDEGSHTGCYNWARSDMIPVDPNKLYRYSIWVRSTDITMNNYVGFYVYDANKTRIAGSWNNPYFKTGENDTNTWRPWTGFLGPSYAGGATGCDSTRTNGDDWCMPSNAAYVEIRFGSCYADGNNNGHTYFMYPEIEEFNPDDVFGPGGYNDRGIYLGYHTLSSNSNGWLYVGDQNGDVYGSRNLAAYQLHAGAGSIYVGSSIYDGNSDLNLDDYVGIGTSDAQGYRLHVNGDAYVYNGLTLGDGANPDVGATLTGCDACRPGGVIYAPTIDISNGLYVRGNDGSGLYVQNGGGADIDGDITITNGLLKLYKRGSYNPPACNSTNEGGIFYSTTFDQPCFCNGSTWLLISDGSSECEIY